MPSVAPLGIQFPSRVYLTTCKMEIIIPPLLEKGIKYSDCRSKELLCITMASAQLLNLVKKLFVLALPPCFYVFCC